MAILDVDYNIPYSAGPLILSRAIFAPSENILSFLQSINIDYGSSTLLEFLLSLPQETLLNKSTRIKILPSRTFWKCTERIGAEIAILVNRYLVDLFSSNHNVIVIGDGVHPNSLRGYMGVNGKLRLPHSGNIYVVQVRVITTSDQSIELVIEGKGLLGVEGLVAEQTSIGSSHYLPILSSLEVSEA